MYWGFWVGIAVVAFGAYGVMTQRFLMGSDWRLLALFSLVGYAPALVCVWGFRQPSFDGLGLETVIEGLSVGLLTQTAAVMVLKALSSGGKAVTVVPLTALYPAVSLIGAVSLLGETVTPIQLFGTALAIAAVVFLSR
ncbi:MAG: EamA family transporter [Dehalococcoidia bacterium]